MPSFSLRFVPLSNVLNNVALSAFYVLCILFLLLELVKVLFDCFFAYPLRSLLRINDNSMQISSFVKDSRMV